MNSKLPTLRNSPRGMTIEPATGLIVWDYGEQDAGTYTVTIVVSDSEGAKAFAAANPAPLPE